MILFEDDHLLVVNKPAGMNTHAPSPFAGEGVYEWLKHREPRWASLAIVHRLDRETSGVLVLSKTRIANQSLVRQFAGRTVEKLYHLLSRSRPPQTEFVVESSIARAGSRYVSRPVHAGSEQAQTHFRLLDESGGAALVAAQPRTGRTHQIRVHAAASGFPILGDALYGGAPAVRTCLHAVSIRFRHPETDAPVCFECPAEFAEDARVRLRRLVLEEELTNSCRWIHGAADGWPGTYIERLANQLLVRSEVEPSPNDIGKLAALSESGPGAGPLDQAATGVSFQRLDRHVREAVLQNHSPKRIAGDPPPTSIIVQENGVFYETRFDEGYSFGLFLDQRDNRRRLLCNHVAAGFPLFPNGPAGKDVLNAFAYTCAFSVCAAKAGARATSLDLSRKYLDWGRRNLELNALNPKDHDFIFGDVFDWLKRIARRSQQFDAVLIDPPTFSQSKMHGVFRAEKDFAALINAALPVLRPGGVLFASTNAARLRPEDFCGQVRAAIRTARREILAEHYAPQPPDFPVTRYEPAHLKTLWLRVE